jgi:hypothetical protein
VAAEEECEATSREKKEEWITKDGQGAWNVTPMLPPLW